jgi:hypothetical protein
LSVAHPGDLEELQSLVTSKVLPVINGAPGFFSAELPTTATAGTANTRTNGQLSLAISVLKEPGANTVSVANAVMEKLDEARAALPTDVEIITDFNRAVDIEASIESLQREATLGAVGGVDDHAAGRVPGPAVVGREHHRDSRLRIQVTMGVPPVRLTGDPGAFPRRRLPRYRQQVAVLQPYDVRKSAVIDGARVDNDMLDGHVSLRALGAICGPAGRSRVSQTGRAAA